MLDRDLEGVHCLPGSTLLSSSGQISLRSFQGPQGEGFSDQSECMN